MLAYIKGSLEMKFKNYIVIDVGGLGYKIFMSETAINELGEIGETIKVFTYYRVREDDISIFGFRTQEELRMFELLLSVSGVGAKSALAMLSCIEPSDFAIAVISNNLKLLTQIPGIGTKSAQRIILELKDKMSLEDAFEKKSEHVQTLKISGNGQVRNDAVMALTALGYSSAESLKAVSAVEITEEMDVEAVLKAALKHMSLL